MYCSRCGLIHAMHVNPSCNLHRYQAMKDYHLALIVCALVTVDVVILSGYTLVEGLRGNLEPTRTVNAENPLETRGVSRVDACDLRQLWKTGPKIIG